MSVNPPPNPNVSTFNNLYWITADISLTQAAADLRYLKWNVAQGDETLQGITVNGNANFYSPTIFNETDVGSLTSLATQPDYTDSTTKIPTTAWVQGLVAGADDALLASNNVWTGTNAFNNVAPPTSTSIQPAFNDSSTKIPTTAWVQTAVSAASIPADLTPNSITITRTNVASSSTAGIINNYNNGAYIDQGITNTNNVAYNANFTPNVPLQIIFANNSGSPTLSPYSAGVVVVNINCFFYNGAKTSYGQTECKLTLFGNLLAGSFGSTNGTFYNLNNQINGDGSFNYSSPTYAPTGRQYWTYDQVFSGARSATPAYLQGVNNGDGTYTVFVYFQAEVAMTWSYNATIVNAAGLAATGNKGIYLG